LFYSSDLEKTRDFYASLGFEVEKMEDVVRIKVGDYTYAFIDENKTPIQNESGMKPKGLGIYSYVEVEDVDEYYKSLKEKNISSTEPKDWPWGKREFVVKDPDGYKVVFFSYTKS